VAKQSYAQVLHNSRLMAAGLDQNSDKWGLTKEFIKKINDTVNAAQNLENEQETLKAKLKEKTVVFDANMAELVKQLSEAKKVIKLEMPQETWKEFGIEDKK
jgi:response regulator RpfG family c-di-GMP phosphodiesterase